MGMAPAVSFAASPLAELTAMLRELPGRSGLSIDGLRCPAISPSMDARIGSVLPGVFVRSARRRC